jgi:enolase
MNNKISSIRAMEILDSRGNPTLRAYHSGETEDTFLADFAVAMDGGHLKTGSASRSEWIAKYNRLLEIEQALGKSA